MTDVTVAPAHAGDMDIVEALLVREHLPLDGLREHPQHMFVARAGDRVVGCASLELYGNAALLRSVVVAAEYRRDGVGESLVGAALRFAERSSVSSVFLLTTTAEHFFPRFGFTVVDRADVPPAVRASAEFARVCPSSAIIMRKFVVRDS
jgi:amino-acid N-acetyltransferase